MLPRRVWHALQLAKIGLTLLNVFLLLFEVPFRRSCCRNQDVGHVSELCTLPSATDRLNLRIFLNSWRTRSSEPNGLTETGGHRRAGSSRTWTDDAVGFTSWTRCGDTSRARAAAASRGFDNGGFINQESTLQSRVAQGLSFVSGRSLTCWEPPD